MKMSGAEVVKLLNGMMMDFDDNSNVEYEVEHETIFTVKSSQDSCEPEIMTHTRRIVIRHAHFNLLSN